MLTAAATQEVLAAVAPATAAAAADATVKKGDSPAHFLAPPLCTSYGSSSLATLHSIILI
eukprot:9496-Heterococcus_DN1.PRE.1